MQTNWERFRDAVVVLAGGAVHEVTTFRADGVYRDHRRPEAVTFAEHSSGRYDFRFGTRKSKTRCRPGLLPVWKQDQATGDSAG